MVSLLKENEESPGLCQLWQQPPELVTDLENCERNDKLAKNLFERKGMSKQPPMTECYIMSLKRTTRKPFLLN